MYTVKTISEVLKGKKKYKSFKLCYIDDIPQTYSDYDEETKEYIKTEEFKRFKELYGWSRRDPKVQFKEYPTKDYIPGFQTFYAYFTPIELRDQWGDDVDDIPYEYNAGEPYDDCGGTEYEILKIPFSYPIFSSNLNIKQPKDYSLNSHWSVEGINLGAIPWIFARTCHYKGSNDSVYIMAGTNPQTFIEKIKEIYLLETPSLDLQYEGSYSEVHGLDYRYVHNRVLHIIKDKITDRVFFFDEKLNPTFATTNYRWDSEIIDYYDDWLYHKNNNIYSIKTVDKLCNSDVEKLIDKLKNPWKYIENGI